VAVPKRAALIVLVLAVLVPAAAAQRQHGRLFPPQDLGLLEGPDREAWQRPQQIMDALLIGEESVVADLGAGGGWFTIRLARRAVNGKVYAEDIQREMIESIQRRVQREGLTKVVRFILGTASDPALPEPVDAVLIVDAYHEMDAPVALLRNVAKSLKPNGRLGIVDFTKYGGGPGPDIEERVDPERVIHDAEAAGLRLHSRPNFLRYQYLLVFVRNDAGTR
jgi:SAM-dependent methyltransferase